MAIISVRNLGVKRGETLILQDLSWEVGSGEHWTVLGANGSGKTSLLSCLTGYVTPSQGEVTVLDRRYGRSDWRELRKEVGLVSSSIRHLIRDEQTALEVAASGRNAELNLWHSPRGELQRSALEALEQVELGDLAGRPWRYLSQGERQRTLIGRALVARFRILILDESCAGLDPVAREKFLAFIQRLGQAVQTLNLIMVTHHVEEILPCFSRALILRAGRILAQGEARRVITSTVLSEAFDARVKVHRRGGRFALDISAADGTWSDPTT
jgi:iron complex transport system ATP-binding protein